VRDLAGLISTLLYIEIILILIRVALSWFPGVDPWNPLVRALRTVVDPVLYPFRRILPTFAGFDLSPILAIIVLDQIRTIIDPIANGVPVSVTFVLALIIRRVVLDIIIFFVIIVLLRLVMSIFHADPFHPLVRMVRDASTPLVRPFASVMPRSRSLDMAALLAFAVFVVAYFVAQRILDEIVIHSV
jgi:YggT family protein